MTYNIKEVFYTLQGEGANAGRAAVFCRFTGCNLWSGREVDRANAICQFCDTDFVGTDGDGGGKFSTAELLANHIASKWPHTELTRRFVVLTGGEPLLQVNEALTEALHHQGFTIAVETNGTLPLPVGVDWVCVSPKAGAPLVVHDGQELKVIFPQKGIDIQQLTHLNFEHFYIQPMDGLFARQNTQKAIDFCKENPIWKLSVQTHKVIGIR
jgi:7-carboxy-7-deazaguanine synthase